MLSRAARRWCFWPGSTSTPMARPTLIIRPTRRASMRSPMPAGPATGGRWQPIRAAVRSFRGRGDPYPGYYVSMTALTNPDVSDAASTSRYVDARRIPYVVLPGGRGASSAFKKAGIRLGDLAIVYNVRTQKIAAAIWADTGPSDQIGEGSIKLAELLGYSNTSPRTGGTSTRENLYLVFPGDEPRLSAPGRRHREERLPDIRELGRPSAHGQLRTGFERALSPGAGRPGPSINNPEDNLVRVLA